MTKAEPNLMSAGSDLYSRFWKTYRAQPLQWKRSNWLGTKSHWTFILMVVHTGIWTILLSCEVHMNSSQMTTKPTGMEILG